MKQYELQQDGTFLVTGEDDPLTQQDYENAVQNLLDTTAQSKGYDSILSACSYAGYPNKFQADGISLGTWRSECWDVCYMLLGEVQSGTRAVPTLDELLGLLPKYIGG